MNLESNFSKKHFNKFSEFVLEIIYYADDEDVKTLLEFIFNIDFNSLNYKLFLLANLLRPIQNCAEYDVYQLPITLPNNNFINAKSVPDDYPLFTVFKKAFNSYYPLFLHLYALCESYYSYITIPIEEKSIIQQGANIYTKYSKTDDIKIHAITNSDKQKIFKMLVNCYKNNKFYYYFNNDNLAKVAIQEYKQNNQIKYKFDEVVYKIYDDDKSTHLVNSEKGIDYNLKTILLRNDDKYNLPTSEEVLIEKSTKLFAHISFDTLKKMHSDIVDAIKDAPKDFCKLCNPNPNKSNAYKLCPKCDEFLAKINEISEHINQDEPNEYLYTIKNRISRYSIFNEFLKKNNREYYSIKKRKTRFAKLINDLKKNVQNEKNNPNIAQYVIKSDYNKLEELILQAKELFVAIF